MVRSLAGQQRITLAEARAEARTASELMRAHRKICLDCQRTRKDPYAFCDEGWPMAKRESRAKYQLHKFSEGEVKGQASLF